MRLAPAPFVCDCDKAPATTQCRRLPVLIFFYFLHATLRIMEARVNFDLNEATTLFDSDPSTIPTPEASRTLQECEDDPEALSSLSLINSELDPVVDAVAGSPDAITHSSVFDTLQFLLKCVPVRPIYA